MLIESVSFVSVVMHKDKDENGGLHRPRELTAFDHTPLDGEMFLQVIISILKQRVFWVYDNLYVSGFKWVPDDSDV